MVKFDDSLQILVNTIEEVGVELNDVIIVRDGFGRLIVAAAQALQHQNTLETKLRDRLGAYASPMTIIVGSSAEGLRRDPNLKKIKLSSNPPNKFVSYIDRRIVGADWLAAPATNLPGPPRLVFGSLKGGVGRSTALTVLAADLARAGKRVLAVDLDMEAPGIGFMLLPKGSDIGSDKRPKYGTVDYLLENGLNGIKDEDLDSFIGVAPFSEGFIHVLPAVGRVTDEHPETMIAKLSRSIVEDISSDGSKRVGQQISDMIQRFSNLNKYDAILIDSRAGMAEISAAPLISLGAEILLFGTDQEQTFRGYRYILSHISSNRNPLDDTGWSSWRERVSFVQAKAPSSASKRKSFREALYSICAECLYDEETLDANGRVIAADFNPSPAEIGPGIPHDSWHIEDHTNYDAFDPLRDTTQLDLDVYQGPFANFLTRAWETLGLERT